jgi:hypothetical protein
VAEPDDGAKPRIDAYDIDRDGRGPEMLDGLPNCSGPVAATRS